MKITDNSKQVIEDFKRKVSLAAKAIGETAEGYAKLNCPVDTGRLRNSISHAEKENNIYIGTNVEYAPVIEFKDMAHKTGRAHFLRDAATTHGEEYKNIADAILKENT